MSAGFTGWYSVIGEGLKTSICKHGVQMSELYIAMVDGGYELRQDVGQCVFYRMSGVLPTLDAAKVALAVTLGAA